MRELQREGVIDSFTTEWKHKTTLRKREEEKRKEGKRKVMPISQKGIVMAARNEIYFKQRGSQTFAVIYLFIFARWTPTTYMICLRFSMVFSVTVNLSLNLYLNILGSLFKLCEMTKIGIPHVWLALCVSLTFHFYIVMQTHAQVYFNLTLPWNTINTVIFKNCYFCINVWTHLSSLCFSVNHQF